MFERNPYHPLLPPDDPTLFYGHQEAVAFLRRHMVGAVNKDILILFGRLGMGKTSLLHQTAFVVDERYQTVYVDTSAADLSSTAAFLIYLSGVIRTRMEAIGASTYRLPEVPPPSIQDSDLRTWFADDFLDVAVTAIRRDRFLVLMLDDMQLLFQAIDAEKLPADFIDYLGNLLGQHERLDIVAAVDVAYEARAMHHPTTANIHTHFRLHPLDPSAARQLIIEPVAAEYGYEEETIQAILKLCGGFPFLLHSVCRLVYRARENNPAIKVIPPEFLDYIYTAALEETGEVMHSLWERTSPNQRAALHALLDLRQQHPEQAAFALGGIHALVRRQMNQTQLVAALRTLEYDALIKTTTNGEYYFCTALEAAWLENQRSEAARQVSRWVPSRRLLGGLAVLAAIILILLLLGLGVFNQQGETLPETDAPPTATFAIDIDATRRAEQTSTP